MNVHLCACMYAHVKACKYVMFIHQLIHVTTNVFQHHLTINDKNQKYKWQKYKKY